MKPVKATRRRVFQLGHDNEARLRAALPGMMKGPLRVPENSKNCIASVSPVEETGLLVRRDNRFLATSADGYGTLNVLHYKDKEHTQSGNAGEFAQAPGTRRNRCCTAETGKPVVFEFKTATTDTIRQKYQRQLADALELCPATSTGDHKSGFCSILTPAPKLAASCSIHSYAAELTGYNCCTTARSPGVTTVCTQWGI